MAVLDDIVEGIRRRIERDLDRVTDDVRPLVEFICGRVYDPDLNVDLLKRSCPASRRILRRFRQQLGRRPKAYISHWRLRAARRLIVKTEAKIWQIAEKVGHAPRGFSERFRKWSGLSPLEMRRAAGFAGASEIESDGEASTLVAERLALVGSLAGDEVPGLIDRLTCRYPLVSPGASLHRFLAEEPYPGTSHEKIRAAVVAARRHSLEDWRFLASWHCDPRRPAQDRMEKREPVLSLAEETALLCRATEPLLAAIATAEATMSSPLAAVLGELRRNVFEPGYTVTKLKRKLGIRDNELMIGFHQQIGLPPARYIQETRLEGAALMLPELSAGKIVALVGYANSGWFRKKFSKWSGLFPRVYREKLRRVMARFGPPPPRAFSWDYWRRAYAGRMDDAEARELSEYILKIYFAAHGTTLDGRLSRTFEIGSLGGLDFLKEVVSGVEPSRLGAVSFRLEGRSLALEVEPPEGGELSQSEYDLAATIEGAYRGLRPVQAATPPVGH